MVPAKPVHRGHSLSPIALHANHALLSATRTYQQQVKHARSVVQAVS
eukprot:COSAG02_NODE_57705_length_279_cov_2.022222_1_plen_46_part_10